MSEPCPYIRTCHDAMRKHQSDRRTPFPMLFRLQYCEGFYQACARYLVTQAHGQEAVPHDLLPVDTERVAALRR